MISTADVAKTTNKIGSVSKRNPVPSAASVSEDILDFMLDIVPELYPDDGSAKLMQFIDDLKYFEEHDLSEALHRAKKSTTISRIVARRWYSKNKGRVRKLQKRLKTNAAKKKAEIMAKSQRTPVKKRKKRKYNTKSVSSQ